jgi:DNA-binding protein Fis
MNTTLQTTTTFAEKMMNKVKESIGDLITDEELKLLIEKGIQTAFFEPHYELDRYNSLNIKREPLMSSIVKECLNKQVELAVKDYFASNPEEVKSLVDQVLREGLTKCVLQVMDNKLQNSMFQMRDSISNMLRGMQ